MLLVLNVVYQGKISAQVARDLHRSKSWASDWLKRYDKEGIEGLKTRPKSGRPSELSEEIVYQIKKELKESNQGWTTKQVEELIIKKSGIKYHYTIYTVSFENGDLNRRYQERYMLILHLWRKKRLSKKGHSKYLWISTSKQQQEQEQDSGFTVVSLDESFFFYDSLVRRVWIEQDKRPISQSNRLTPTFMCFWSHKHGRRE